MIILILCIQLIVVHADGQSNNEVTKFINYVRILFSGLTDYITYLDCQFVHLNQLSKTGLDDFIKNHMLIREELKEFKNTLLLLGTKLTDLAAMPLDKEEYIQAAKIKSIVLQTEFDHLNKELNKYRISRNLPLLYDFKTIDKVLEKYNDLVSVKIRIDKEIEDKEQIQLVDDCVLALELTHTDAAAEKFNLVKDDNKINDIVNRTYLLNNGAFYLLELARNVVYIKKTYLLYEALFNQLHNDKERCNKNVIRYFDRYHELLKRLKRDILDQPVIDSDLKAKALQLLKAIRGDKVKLGSKLLTDIVVGNRKKKGVRFLQRPLTYDYEAVGEICYQTIVENHKQYLNSLKETLNAIFKKLSEPYEGNILHFGQLIKYLETKLNGTEYESSLQLNFANVKKKLPKIVRNILYSEKVCIKLDGSDYYLKQTDGMYTYLTESYTVHLGLESLDLEERWKLIQVHDDEYIIKNLLHNYALDAVTTPQTPGKRINNHLVITTNKNQQSNIWKIEVSGDYAYLKNTASNEYLYVSLEYNKGDAATSNFCGKISNAYQWNILDCTDVPLREGPPSLRN